MNRLLIVILLSGVASGCGKKEIPREPVFPVSGTITMNGKPVIGADVTFYNAEKKRSAFGRTNELGAYSLTTFSMNDGAVEGRAILTVTKFVPELNQAPEADVESDAYVPPQVGVPRKKKTDKTAKPKPEIPARYSNQATSGLMAVVSPDAENNLNFDLTM